jgi:membrane associated rhomboid family serine protease
MDSSESGSGRRPRLGALGRRTRPSTSTEVLDGGYGSGRWEGVRPYATIAIVAASAGVLIAWHAWPPLQPKLIIAGPLGGDWWRLFSYAFTYGNGVYAFASLLTIAVFGWLLEQRHGPVVVLVLFLGASVAGALLALAVYRFPILTGGNAGALALVAAWAAPDLRAARAGRYYEGDLLGAGVAAAVLLVIPFAIQPFGVEDADLIGSAASWLAGVCGGVIGLLAGFGLGRLPAAAR